MSGSNTCFSNVYANANVYHLKNPDTYSWESAGITACI